MTALTVIIITIIIISSSSSPSCRRARLYVLAIGVFSAVYNLPRFWEITWVSIFDPRLNATVTVISANAKQSFGRAPNGSTKSFFPPQPPPPFQIYDAAPLRTDETYINVYINWLYLVFMYLLPFSCLAALNLLIYREVKRASRERARLTRLQQKELGLATMLMVVVVVFLVCNALPFVLNVLVSAGGQWGAVACVATLSSSPSSSVFLLFQEVVGIRRARLNNVSSLLVTLNSSVNFVVYCIFGGKFKRIFLRLFCPQGRAVVPWRLSRVARCL